MQASTLSHTIGTSTTRILKSNPKRKYVLIVNNSDTVQYIALGEAASASKGIRLNASGGSYEMTSLNLWYGDVWAYCSASKEILTTEY